MIEELLIEKLNRLKIEDDEKILLDLSLLNASVGNNEVAKLYLNEFKSRKKDGNIDNDIMISSVLIDYIYDDKFHLKWNNYRRERNQNEKKMFAVTASICQGNVLEIGCGNGDLSSYISMYGNRVFGIDIDPIAIEIARYKVWNYGLSDCFFTVEDANEIKLPDSYFDTVVLAEVLEHVEKPEKVIREAIRLCKNNGKVLISVPNGYKIPSPDHINIFNIDLIVKLLKSLGVAENNINFDNRVPSEWIFCWFYNKKDENKYSNCLNIIDLESYFLPPHPLEDLNKAGKVSVILPTFNGESYINESIDSILKQTYKNFEIIVIDDGSVDKTFKKLKPYIDKNQIKYLYQENLGKPVAVNKGIDISNGDFIWIFDDDDTAFPRKLEVQMRNFLRNPNIDLIHTGSIYTDSDNRLPLMVWEPSKIDQMDLLKGKLHGCLFHGGSVIVRKKCYSEVGMWDERLIRAQDYDMWIRMIRRFNIYRISIPTVTYRQHKKLRGSKSNPVPYEKIAIATKEYEKIIMDKIYNNIPLDEIFPEIKENPDNEGLKVSALIERAYAMAKRELFEYTLSDLKEAFDLAIEKYPVALTYRAIYFINKFNEMISNIPVDNIKHIISYFTLLINNHDVSNFPRKMNLTLSLCLITKDEEKNIARCINSVKDIVDEIVVVDTGSKDKTVEIAKSFGEKVKVINAKWEDDFSKARNTAIENATSDWILFLDADEEIKKEDVEKIKPLLYDDTVEAYMFKFINYSGASVSSGLSEIHYNFRLFRNNGKLKYVYPIHENLKNIEEDRAPIFKNADVTILHYGYLSEIRIEKNKTQRYIDMISKYLAKHPNDKFQQGNLAVEYYNAGEYNKALKHLLIATKSMNLNSYATPRLFRYLIMTYIALKEYDTALRVINDAKRYYEDIPDYKYLEGTIYFNQKRYEKALEIFKECALMGEYKGQFVTMGGTGSYRAKYMIGQCYEKLGKLNDAVKEYMEILKQYPNYQDVFIKVFDMFVRNEKPEDVYEFFRKHVNTKVPLNYIVVARQYINIGKYDIAKQYIDSIDIDLEGLNNLRGIIYMGLKDYENAIKHFEMEYGKAKEEANYREALCYIILKDIDKAKDLLWKITDSSDKKLYMTIVGEMKVKFDEVKDSFFNLLDLLIKLKEFDLYNEVLNLYVGLFTREEYERYGQMMINNGLDDLAVEAYIKAADLNSQNTEVYKYLGQKAYDQNMFNEALSIVGRAYNIDKTDVDIYRLIYKIYKALGQDESADEVNEMVKSMYPEVDLSESYALT
ncbi:glycosyltransferase [Thermoanaerobacterium thermosaccharolyticum]|uniref:Glycosyl transferase n=1 Tax=Thermoanaerobacterium thermosaccharolyticum M0795 TaxID=698948 RepID=L0INQ1_THETR|nr:glycosyltransferase [Thermoanaerobacterium thermosaccharolyticum]AGB19836.1 glycosyl transferase [Thermoanaerobacterium thermosaccharolyticum M0795]